MLNRREGMQAAALTALSYARVLGANERMQLGLIGAGEHGRYVTSIFQKTDQIDLRPVCDVFGERAQQAVADAPGARPFADHRRLLDTKDLDAVLIAARRPRQQLRLPGRHATGPRYSLPGSPRTIRPIRHARQDLACRMRPAWRRG